MNIRILQSYLHLLVFFLLGLFSCQNKPTKTAKDLINPKATEQTVKRANSSGDILFIGTYTRKEPHVNGKAEGIYVYEMNKRTGELSLINTFKGVINPSYLAIHPNKKYLYAVNEHVGTTDFEQGTISAFSIHPNTKNLNLINIVSAEGNAPCYV